MKLRIIMLSILTLIFTSCSSKNELKINERINSISLNRNITIATAPKTVKSPVSIGLGIGGSIFRHVGISMGTDITPNISNDKALVLERAINMNNILLEDLITKNFDTQMKNDTFYKNKYVPFGSNYSISLYVPKYYLDTDTFSSKANVKISMNAKIYNHQNQIVYETTQKSNTSSIYAKKEILNSKDILTKALNSSIKNVIQKIISDMKKN